jgi:hypothetical protein
MESLKPKSAKVWWALLGVFVALALMWGAALYGVMHAAPRSACVSSGGEWNPDTETCTPAPESR